MKAEPIRRWTRPAVVALLSLLAALPALCVTAVAQEPSPKGGTTIRFGWTDDPDSLNPFVAREPAGAELVHLNYDLLVGYDAATLKPVPELAQRWERSADGLVWTFHLRNGVTWSDGEPFTADDVVWTYRSVMSDPKSRYASHVTLFEEVEKVDDQTVRITTSKPKANMLDLWIPILPEHIWSAVPRRDATTTYPNDAPVVGTGPFQVVEWKKGEYVRLKRNDAYWRARPNVPNVVLRTYKNADKMVQDLKSGRLAAIYPVPEAWFTSLAEEQGVKAITCATKGFEELGFNCCTDATSKGHPALRDPKFRQALNWAVDKKQIVKDVYGGYANPATSILQSHYFQDPDYHWEPQSADAYTFDLSRAQAALDAAGYADADGDGVREMDGEPIRLRLWARTQSPTSQKTGNLLSGWFRDVGLDIQLDVLDDAVLAEKLYAVTESGRPAPDYDMFLWSWGGGPDPDFILSVMLTGQIMSWSDTYYSNPEYDRLYLEQQVAQSAQDRKQIIHRMQEILYEESPYIVLAYPLELQAYDVARWQGWVRSPAKTGAVFATADNVDSYISVAPRAQGVLGGGGLSAGVLAVVVAAAAAAVGIVVWALVRHARKE